MCKEAFCPGGFSPAQYGDERLRNKALGTEKGEGRWTACSWSLKKMKLRAREEERT